jgi:hypothetical protein
MAAEFYLNEERITSFPEFYWCHDAIPEWSERNLFPEVMI